MCTFLIGHRIYSDKKNDGKILHFCLLPIPHKAQPYSIIKTFSKTTHLGKHYQRAVFKPLKVRFKAFLDFSAYNFKK
jgi:hypothetical protein